jgi:hypothetical protein
MPCDIAIRRAGSTLRTLLGPVLVALVAALLVAAPAHGQALPQSLEGEMFVADQLTVTADCSNHFTITYTASGPATGPYTGTFTETGTITGTFTPPFWQIEEWNVSFAIDSPQGQVNGTKTFGANGLVPLCGITIPLCCRVTAEASAQLDYRATIKTAAGTFADQGQATAAVEERFIFTGSGQREVKDFQETFILSTGVLATHGKATGGGQVISGSSPLNRVTFGFNVRKTPDGSRLQGNCNVRDHATSTHIKCLTVTDYVQTGNTATWEGTASVNGVQRPYRITVQDNGEPNKGADTFSITAGTYQAGGNVQNGNVQIHKQ